MNITGLLLPLALAPSIMKFIKRTESKGSVTPPTSKVGKRPECGIGQKAVFNEHLDKYICVPDFK